MKKRASDIIQYTIIGIIIALIVLFVVAMMISSVLYQHNDDFNEEFSHSFSIYALEDNTAYILSRYSSESRERYHFLRKMNGGYKSGYIPASESYIYETSEQPRIEVYHKKVDKEWVNKIHGYLSDGFEQTYRIYVPDNSIKYDFNVDLK